jgi:hypothetical protein
MAGNITCKGRKKYIHGLSSYISRYGIQVEFEDAVKVGMRRSELGWCVCE